MKKQINWNDKEFLQKVISESSTKKQVLESIGYNSKSSTSRKKIKRGN